MVMFNIFSSKSKLENRFKSEVIDRFKNLMDSISDTQSSNKLDYSYTVQEVYRKHYGFDAVITMPYGKNLTDFRKLLPSIGVIYKGNIIAEYTSTRSSIYMRCHIQGLKLNTVDEIKFKWYMFFSDKKYRTDNGDTFTLNSRKAINHPTKKDDEGKSVVIGHEFKIYTPSGLSYDTLQGCIVDLNKEFGICTLKYDDNSKTTTIEILQNRLGDNEKFEIIKTKPHELYIAMTNSYEPIILDFKYSPNMLIGGQAGSGKTIAMITAFINLINNATPEEVNLYITMLSDKQDLKLFKNCYHTKQYSKTLNDAYKQLRELVSIISKRNKLFDSFEDEDTIITNVYEYNTMVEKGDRLPLVYYMIDEIASFSVNGTEMDKEEKALKELCSALMWKIAREGRSAGVYCCLCTQRGSVKNLDPEVKSNLSNSVCFSFPNIPSAMTILGDGELASLAIKQNLTREFICVANKTYFGKTLYLDNKMMIDLVKPFRKTKEELEQENSPKVLDITQKTSENDQKQPENNEKKAKKNKKANENVKSFAKNKKKESKVG